MCQGLLFAVCLMAFNGLSQAQCEEEQCYSSPDVCFPTVNKCDLFPDCPNADDEHFLVCPKYPQGCRGFQRVKTFCFESTNKQLSWENAKQECKSRGAHLVEAVTRGEVSTLTDYIKEYIKHNVWIGLTDKVENGKFVWNYSRTAFDRNQSKIFTQDPNPFDNPVIGGVCVKTTIDNLYRWDVITCLAKFDAICQLIHDRAEFKFTGYKYTPNDTVRAEDEAYLQVFYGRLKIKSTHNNSEIYKEMDVWAGRGRNSYNLVCTVNLVSKISTDPCQLTSSNPANLVYKFSLSLPVRFSQSGQELWVMVNPNVRKTEKLERNRHVKFNYTIGRLPTYYRVQVKVDRKPYNVKDSSITKVGVRDDVVDLQVCYQIIAARESTLNFTSLLREVHREGTYEIYKGNQDLCHSYPHLQLPVQVIVTSTSTDYPEYTFRDVFEVAIDEGYLSYRSICIILIPVLSLTSLASLVISYYYMRLWHYLSTPGLKSKKDRPLMFIWFGPENFCTGKPKHEPTIIRRKTLWFSHPQ